MEKNKIDKSRRQFLKVGSFAGAGLLIGFQLSNCNGKTEHPAFPQIPNKAGFAPNAWISIRRDDTVTVMVNHSEMGQGISTALPMIVAEELEADWSKVRFEIAPVADVFKHPTYGIQWTVSSRSVESSWDLLREAGAAARELLISAAAATWGVSPKECRAENSRVIHESSGKILRYGELINKAAEMPMPEKIGLKKPQEFKIIGRPVHRLDTITKTDGKARFGIDIKLPGMLSATVVHPPVFGSSVKSFNQQKMMTLRGVSQVFPIETGIAIVADTFWQARMAMETLEVEWEDSQNINIDSEHLFKRWDEMGKQKGKSFFETGDIDKFFKNADAIFEATYHLPYQAHATPEPMNCTADVREKTCEVWVPTQNQEGAQETAARITGLDNSAIKIHTTYLGGGFGRRALVDYVAEAVEISHIMKAPVKVTWSREEDMRHDYYRPATCNVMKAVIDRRGKPIAWLHRIVGADVFGQALPKVISAMMPDATPRFIKNTATSLAERLMPRFVSGKKAILGAGPLPYSFENMRVEFINDDPGVPICWWRSVAPSSNCYAVECFIDEMPLVSTHIVSSSQPPTGIGEVAVPVIGPAVANAVFAATGKPVRKLPITPQVLRQS